MSGETDFKEEIRNLNSGQTTVEKGWKERLREHYLQTMKIKVKQGIKQFHIEGETVHLKLNEDERTLLREIIQESYDKSPQLQEVARKIVEGSQSYKSGQHSFEELLPGTEVMTMIQIDDDLVLRIGQNTSAGLHNADTIQKITRDEEKTICTMQEFIGKSDER